MTNLLDHVSIASPCSADWQDMRGDERRRFCASCKLHVHDLSAMTREQAEDVLRGAGKGRVCVRLFRRADGRVLTRDCPVGWRRQLRAAWVRAAALCISLWSSAVGCVRPQSGAVEPSPVPTSTPGEYLMGDIVPPSPSLPSPAGKPGVPPVGPLTPFPK